MTDENQSIKTPSSDCSKKVTFNRPKLNFENLNNSNKFYADNVFVRPISPKYQRKASVFLLNHLNDIKHTGLGIGERCSYWLYRTIKFLSRRWFTHCFLIIIVFLYTVCGALIFLTVEGQNETKLIERDVQLQIEELLSDLRSKSLVLPRQFSLQEWRGEAARKIAGFEEQIKRAYDRHPLVVSHTDGKVWTIWNAIVYCSTLYTTIGYGHLYPTTFTGRVLTIVYSTIGIPLFLIALTDFGKLFTRGIKYIWSHVRRLYYTGSCRKVRKTSQVQEIFKGAQVMYNIAVFRRPSTQQVDESENITNKQDNQYQTITEPPTPGIISNFEIDDEFNLPITLALCILVTYMLCGTVIFMSLEEWDFFSSFYFIFISMSTVGFGDVVPDHPIFMILSIVYLCFGLALMTMCFNVVQDKLSDTFTHASAKLGGTMGIGDEEENEDVTELSCSNFAAETDVLHEQLSEPEDNTEGKIVS
ncbi:TWiK family of potassium channels protein 18-like [Sitophilus oryzae]|uniref:TWiK family of potassium channels protein 18-like n=1 Tax=Sitophilus oryzae TaxID=7048 RepID=A0A6J2XG24_SITOR|nr:TWiK family of potassium channels protein 18-like [Sitophilus oryzae]